MDCPRSIATKGAPCCKLSRTSPPNSRLGFATADGGQANFADNIRSLAGLPGGSRSGNGFKANVIIDDVVYEDEPMFQDGLIAQAVNEVAGTGVAYFSSAESAGLASLGFCFSVRA
jgi:hypothetical protein